MTSKRTDLIKLSFQEEVGNVISHGVMVALLLMLLPIIAIRSYLIGGPILAFGNSVFIIALILMFLASTLYHSMAFDSKHKVIFRILDHIFIFVAIAGTYTPVALYAISGVWGIVILIIQWTCVISGVLYKVLAKSYNKKITLAIYLIMGWSALFFLPVIISKTNPIFLGLIALGGILYTIGTWFYAQKTRPYFHFIWHIFINLAAISHLVAVIFFLV